MILSLVIGCAMTVMASWQLWLIARGETTVEASDNGYYRTLLEKQGRTFLNPYDLGRLQNLQLFFNVAPLGE
jgi:palmitoyltransferase